MKKSILFLSLLFMLSVLSAQNLSPWNSKFIVTAGSYSDTAWFGCDTAGGKGYQSGLDILDSSGSSAPLKIVSYDSLVMEELNTGTCGNLKRNIKGFRENRFTSFARGYYLNAYYQLFDFFVLIDTDVTGSNTPVLLSWDSSDYSFNNDSFEVSSTFINSNNGYFNAVEAGLNTYSIYSNYLTESPSSPDYAKDSVYLIVEDFLVGTCSSAYSKYDLIFQYDQVVQFNMYDTTTLINDISDKKVRVGRLYPNPNLGV